MVSTQTYPVTTQSSDAIAAIDTFVDQALAYGKHAETAILQAISADPTCAIAHAYAAAYYLSQESKSGRQQAVPYLQAAQRHAPQASIREQRYIQAIAAWAAGDINGALALHEAIAVEFPQDLMSVQQGQYHYFYQGNARSLLQIATAVLPANLENAYLCGMVAFGLEQCHWFDAAEYWGRHATALKRHNPWAHHAVAHVMEMQGRIDEGIAWMEHLSDTWDQCNSMLYTHNWWHVALYYIKRRDFQTVLTLYDTHIWGRSRPDSPKDQVGAIALLLRLELCGLEVGDRWQPLATHLVPRIHEHALPFQDLHYIYALTRAGKLDCAKEMLLSMEAHTHHCAPELQTVWKTIAVPAAYGLMAHAQGEWQRAIAHLKEQMPQFWRVGGSHAQRQLFEQIYADAVKKAEAQPRLIQHKATQNTTIAA